MWAWLSKIDPDTAIMIITAVGGWLYSKVRGERLKTVEEIVNGAVKAILSEIAEHVPTNVPIDTWLTGARRYVNERIWKALAKVHVAKSPALERLVAAALERATSDLSHRIAEERRARNQAPQ